MPLNYVYAVDKRFACNFFMPVQVQIQHRKKLKSSIQLLEEILQIKKLFADGL